MEKILIINRGLPGAGKSTNAKSLAPKENIFSTDDYWGIEYKFDVTKLKEAHQWNVNRVETAMAEGKTPIVVDNTNTRWGQIKPYANLAQIYNYNVKYSEPTTPWWADISKKLEDPTIRDINNPEFIKIVDILQNKNIHNVPRNTLSSMVLGWENTKDLPSHYKTFKEHYENVEGIKNELYSAAKTGNGLANYIENIDKSGDLDKILPEIKALQGKLQPIDHHPEGDCFKHTISALKASRSTNPLTNLAILLHDVGKSVTYSPTDRKGNPKHTYYGHDKKGAEIIETIANRLGLSNSDKDTLKFCADRHMLIHNPDRLNKNTIKKIVSNPAWPNLRDVAYADEMSRPSPIGNESHILNAIKYMEDTAANNK